MDCLHWGKAGNWSLHVFVCCSQEQEMKKQKELEKQLEKQRQFEMEREEERRKAMEQREVWDGGSSFSLSLHSRYLLIIFPVVLWGILNLCVFRLSLIYLIFVTKLNRLGQI